MKRQHKLSIVVLGIFLAMCANLIPAMSAHASSHTPHNSEIGQYNYYRWPNVDLTKKSSAYLEEVPIDKTGTAIKILVPGMVRELSATVSNHSRFEMRALLLHGAHQCGEVAIQPGQTKIIRYNMQPILPISGEWDLLIVQPRYDHKNATVSVFVGRK